MGGIKSQVNKSNMNRPGIFHSNRTSLELTFPEYILALVNDKISIWEYKIIMNKMANILKTF